MIEEGNMCNKGSERGWGWGTEAESGMINEDLKKGGHGLVNGGSRKGRKNAKGQQKETHDKRANREC